MPKRRYERREPTHDWQQIQPLLKDTAQIKKGNQERASLSKLHRSSVWCADFTPLFRQTPQLMRQEMLAHRSHFWHIGGETWQEPRGKRHAMSARLAGRWS